MKLWIASLAAGVLLLAALPAAAQKKYTGPRPPGYGRPVPPARQ